MEYNILRHPVYIYKTFLHNFLHVDTYHQSSDKEKELDSFLC